MQARAMTDFSFPEPGRDDAVPKWHGAPLVPGRRSPALRSTKVLLDLLMLSEIAVVHLCGTVAAALYVGGQLGVANYYGAYANLLLMLPIVFGLMLKWRGYYEVATVRDFAGSLGSVLTTLIGAFFLLVVFTFALREANEYSRVWYALWLASAAAAIVVTRTSASVLLDQAARRGLVRRRAAIWGEAARVQGMVAALARFNPEIEVLATFEEEAGREKGEGVKAPALSRLLQFGRDHDLDMVILARGNLDESVESALLDLRVMPAEIYLKLGSARSPLPFRAVASLAGLQLLMVQRRPIAGWNTLLKAIEDYTLAALALFLFTPLLLVLALLIKLDSPGPVFFKQRRNGFNQRVFSVWKFRTMRVMEEGDSFVQAVKGDSRVTRVGKFLRKTSLDELPQLINVLKGDMSIVGPRPHPLALNDQYMEIVESYGSRHKVKPGITGWAQIKGFRGPTADPELMRRRVEFDIDYIDNWSIWFDLRIILATPFMGLIHENAL